MDCLAKPPFSTKYAPMVIDSTGSPVLACSEDSTCGLLFSQDEIAQRGQFVCPKCGRIEQRMVWATPEQCGINAAASALFDKCVVRTCGGRSIKCCLGLWGVSAPNEAAAEREARRYWQQYYADGEYEAHLLNAGDERLPANNPKL